MQQFFIVILQHSSIFIEISLKKKKNIFSMWVTDFTPVYSAKFQNGQNFKMGKIPKSPNIFK